MDVITGFQTVLCSDRETFPAVLLLFAGDKGSGSLFNLFFGVSVN